MRRQSFSALAFAFLLVSAWGDSPAEAAAKKMRDDGQAIELSAVRSVGRYKGDYGEFADRTGIEITGLRTGSPSLVTVILGSEVASPPARVQGVLESCLRFATIAMSNPVKWKLIIVTDLNSGAFAPGPGAPLIIDSATVLGVSCTLALK